MDRRLFLSGVAAPLGVAACSERSVRLPLPGRRASPADAGLDAALMAEVEGQASTLPRLRTLVVARNGERLLERVLSGPPANRAVNIKSASKTVLAAIAGVAIGKGVLALDQPIAPLLRERLPKDPDPRLAGITVEHLLSMRAGLPSTSGPNYGRWASSPDWTAFALAQPVVEAPGGRMIYSTGTSHLLSAVLTEASGRSTLALAREYLGEPLGIDIPAWPADPQGVYLGGNEMRMSPRDLITFGELFRSGGLHEGRRILTAEWIERSWRPQGRSRWTGAGYGLGWWIRTSGDYPVYYAWGYGGQMLFLVPELALTVAMTSDPSPAERDGHIQALHALLDHGIIPAAVRGAGPAGATMT